MTVDPSKILAIDDEPAILDVYAEMLADDGLELRRATTMDAALAALDEGDWSVVLIDQRLHGAAGTDEGLALIGEVDRRSPGAKAIVITGYASPDAIERAFASGVYDYIEKTENFRTLLRAKVRNANELAREKWLTSLAEDAVAPTLAELWSSARAATDRARKGRLLEDLLELLLKQIPGFVVSARRRSLDEEFDLIVRNESSDPLWSKEGQYFLVECKNWTSKVGPDELDRFTRKLERRFGRATLGFLVAANGFTAGFSSTRAADRLSGLLVVPIDEQALSKLIAADNPTEVLKQLHQRAIETSDK
jgi:CheY-like chemotaxis protein